MKYITECSKVCIDGTNVGYIRFREPMEVLSSAVLNGGNSMTSALFIMQVDKDYCEDDPVAHARSVRDMLGLPEDSVGMMTAAEVDYVFNLVEEAYGEADVVAVATAGLSNHVVAGEVLDDWDEKHAISLKRGARLAGTINIAVMTECPLTEAAKVNIMIPLVEAKTAAMNDAGYRETGTTSDSMAIISPVGEDRVDYAGSGTDIGISAARAVRKAVGFALTVRDEHPVPLDAAVVLSKHGYDAARLHTMSGAQCSLESFESSMEQVCRDPRVMVLVDHIVHLSARSDSMYNDGNKETYNIIASIVSQFTGYHRGPARDCIETLAYGIANLIGANLDE